MQAECPSPGESPSPAIRAGTVPCGLEPYPPAHDLVAGGGDAWLALLRHEFRTPLAGLQGLTALLRRANLGPGELALLGAIEAAARQLGGMIDRLASPPATPAHQALAVAVPLDGPKLLEDLLLAHWHRAAGKGIGLHLCVEPAVPGTWLIDGGRLRQILDNLLANAVTATARGHVLLEARLADGAAPPGCRVELVVRDTGVGLGEAPVGRLFEWGTRGPGSAAAHPAGAGIGLYVCRWLASELGGSIHHRARSGGGSEFSLVLPIASAQRVGIRPAAFGRIRCAVALPEPACRVATCLLERIGIRSRNATWPDWERAARGLEAVLCEARWLPRGTGGANVPADGSVPVLAFRGLRTGGGSNRRLQVRALPQPLLRSSAEPVLLEAAVASRLTADCDWPPSVSGAPG